MQNMATVTDLMFYFWYFTWLRFYTFGGYGIRDYSRDSMYLEEHNTESFFQHDTSEHSHVIAINF